MQKKPALDIGKLFEQLPDEDLQGSPAADPDAIDALLANIDDIDGILDDDGIHDTSALYKVVKMLVQQMPSSVLAVLVEVWKHLSQKGEVLVGSGCSGSGMDGHAILVINSVPHDNSL